MWRKEEGRAVTMRGICLPQPGGQELPSCQLKQRSQEILESRSKSCWFSVRIPLSSHVCPGLGKASCFLFQLFYSKLTEYLEDFHIWLSLYSQPPSSSYLLTQRLAVSFCLLCVYACLTALVAVGVGEQVGGSRPSRSDFQISGMESVLLLTCKTHSSGARSSNLAV